MSYQPPFARMRQISRTGRPVEWPVPPAPTPEVVEPGPLPEVEAVPIIEVAPVEVAPPKPEPPVSTPDPVPFHSGMTKRELLAVAKQLKLDIPLGASKTEVLTALEATQK